MKNLLVIILNAFLLFTLTYSCSSMSPPTPVPNTSDESPSWSPDGKWIAYWHYSDPYFNDSTYETGLYVIDSTGQERRLLIAGDYSNPDWSPNDDLIACYNNADIYTITFESKELTRITDSGSAFSPSFSPDGNSLAFYVVTPADSAGIWLYDLNNKSKKYFGPGRDPDWSNTGDNIVYVNPHDSSTSSRQIWIADSSGNNRFRLTSDDGINTNRNPTWSPNGTKIAWSVTSLLEIWIMNADGTGQIRVTSGSYPSWSPDSKKLVFVNSSSDNQKRVLWIVDLENNQIKQLTH